MICKFCKTNFEPKTKSQIFCSRKCERANASYNYANRDEPNITATTRPIAEFTCKNCGKSVFIYSRSDQRSTYCCGKCAVKYKNKLAKERRIKKRGDNLGISSGMSLSSLIRRERRNRD